MSALPASKLETLSPSMAYVCREPRAKARIASASVTLASRQREQRAGSRGQAALSALLGSESLSSSQAFLGVVSPGKGTFALSGKVLS